MSEGQSQRSVTSSAQHRQEAEVTVAEECLRAATETAATAVRLVMAELAAVRAEVEAAAAADAARAMVAKLEAMRVSSTGSSVSADDNRDNELKLARETARADSAVGSHTPPGAPWRQPRRAQTRRCPDGRWPTLNKINYVEWATVITVRLQVWHMWEAVRYGNIDYYEAMHASVATALTRPHCRHFARSGGT
jgi:hypothetical protein